MNELRMYVEHLFEGKVLTADMIELKEEIYGNLVARYEDYVANGMDAAEALERTRASITSVDDVLAGEAGAEDAGDAAANEAMSRAAGAADDGRSAAAASAAADDRAGEERASAATSAAAGDGAAAAPTRPLGAPASPQGTASAVDAAATAGSPSAAGAASAAAPKRWPKIVAIVAGVIVALAVIGGVAYEFFIEPALDRQEDLAELQAEQQWREQQGTGASSSSSGTASQGADTSGTGSGNGDTNASSAAGANGTGATDANSSSAGTSSTPLFADPEDQREYEATTALVQEIDASTVELLQGYASRGSSAEIAGLAAELPLGSNCNAAELDATQAGTAAIDYTGVSEDIDGDAIDMALAYNAAAIFTVYPDISSVRMTVQELYDSAWDVDTYVFTRANVEQSFARASNNAITQLNSSLVESTDAWNQVRGYLKGHEFAEHLVDYAEIG